jgi:hypothetical protein
MALAVVWIVMFGTLFTRIGMPLWMVFVLGTLAAVLSAEKSDPYLRLRAERYKKANLRVIATNTEAKSPRPGGIERISA